MLSANRLQHVPAGEVRQAEAEEHAIGPDVPGDPHELDPACEGMDAQARRLQPRHKSLLNGKVVIDRHDSPYSRRNVHDSTTNCFRQRLERKTGWSARPFS